MSNVLDGTMERMEGGASTDPERGLSPSEAATRLAAGLGNPPPPPSTRTYRQIARENVFTFINTIIFVLGVALVVIGRPLDAIIAIGVIMTNIVVGIGQEVRAKRTLDQVAVLTRPTVTVVRDGEALAESLDQIVIGDLIALTAGDQLVADGTFVSGHASLDESQLTGESDAVPKRPGDEALSGSFVLSGSGRYIIERVGEDSLAYRITAGARSFRRVVTPLQKEINGVIGMALVIVIYLEILLVGNAFLKELGVGETVGQATLLVGLVPNGLFVSIAIAYAVGAVRILRHGALVQQSNAIESLSHVDVLCTDKTGTLTTNRMRLVEVVPLGETDEPAARALLGALVASQSSPNRTSEAIAAACPAEPTSPTVEVDFSSARKWSAATFAAGSGPLGPATLVLGAPQMLAPGLGSSSPGDRDRNERTLDELVAERTTRGERVLLLARSDDVAAIDLDADGEAPLPSGLEPVALAVLRDELRAEAGPTLARFAAADVQVKVISGDAPETVAALVRQAGLMDDLRTVSGLELAEATPEQVSELAEGRNIFGRISPAQKEHLIDALRSRGHYVAMIGDGVNDVLPLKKADLAIAMQSGSPATRGVADIVLTHDSFEAVAPTLEEGQRILNGMQSILSLFLTRIATIGLLVVASLVIGQFPLSLRTASIVTLLTVGIPSVLLAIWAQPGRRVREPLSRLVLRFVAPAAMITSLVGVGVLFGFLIPALAAEAPAGADQATIDAVYERLLPIAQSALAIFLVLSGITLIVFAEPPVQALAVARPRTPDRRPTALAFLLFLGLVFVIGIVVLRETFELEPIGLRGLVVVLAGWLVWFVTLWLTWRLRLIERLAGGGHLSRAG